MVAQISKEATVHEVLAEVTMLDLGQTVKHLLSGIGCFLVFVLALTLSGPVTGNWFGIRKILPAWSSWIILVLMTWGWIAAVTEHKSYHELRWYFPRLKGWASLLLSIYVVGLGALYTTTWNSTAKGLIYAVYIFPFVTFLSVIEIGHAKLIAKREEAARRAM